MKRAHDYFNPSDIQEPSDTQGLQKKLLKHYFENLTDENQFELIQDLMEMKKIDSVIRVGRLSRSSELPNETLEEAINRQRNDIRKQFDDWFYRGISDYFFIIKEIDLNRYFELFKLLMRTSRHYYNEIDLPENNESHLEEFPGFRDGLCVFSPTYGDKFEGDGDRNFHFTVDILDLDLPRQVYIVSYPCGDDYGFGISFDHLCVLLYNLDERDFKVLLLILGYFESERETKEKEYSRIVEYMMFLSHGHPWMNMRETQEIKKNKGKWFLRAQLNVFALFPELRVTNLEKLEEELLDPSRDSFFNDAFLLQSAYI